MISQSQFYHIYLSVVVAIVQTTIFGDVHIIVLGLDKKTHKNIQ